MRLIGDYGKIDEICCGVVNVRQSAATNCASARWAATSTPRPIASATRSTTTSFRQNKIKNYGFSGEVNYDLGPLTLTSITAYRHTRFVHQLRFGLHQRRYHQDQRVRYADQDLHPGIPRLGQRCRCADGLLGAYYFNEKIGQDGAIQWGNKPAPMSTCSCAGASNQRLRREQPGAARRHVRRARG
ncbi:MAG: hypothetical protein QM756_20350 [Polyangiaceae bacterium]